MQEVRHDEAKEPIAPPDEIKKILDGPMVKEEPALNTPPEQGPKVIKEFLLQKGMKINLHGTLYKVTAVRPNKKATMKFVRFLPKYE